MGKKEGWVQKKLTENVRMERRPIRSGTRMGWGCGGYGACGGCGGEGAV